MNVHLATGRRKTAIARVRLIENGTGKFTVNNIDVEKYFPTKDLCDSVRHPLTLTESGKSYDIVVLANGGGKSGQAGAVQLGVSRALVEANADNKEALRGAGVLTRDPRMVERKKYGRRKARKVSQFSKR